MIWICICNANNRSIYVYTILYVFFSAYTWIAVFAIHLRVYDVEIATVDFCGFTNVHRGFKEKLMAMLESTLAEFDMKLLQHEAGTFS